MLALVRRCHPDAKAIGLDSSAPMLGRAKERFNDDPLVELREPGGVFTNLDLARSASPRLHERFRREIGRIEDDPTDRLAGLTEQMTGCETLA